MPISFEVFVAQCLLVFGLATPGIAPYTGVYFALAAMLVGFRPAGAPRQFWLGEDGFRMLFLAVLLLLVPIPFHWAGVVDLYPLLVILPILFAPGAAALVRRFPNVLSLGTMSWALLGGAAGAAGLALYEMLVVGVFRVGGYNNPIHFGGLSAILGFGALTGLFVLSGPWRFVFLAGPVLATLAVVLSGSRGPAIAVFGLALLAFVFLVLYWRKSRLIWVFLLALPVLVFLFWLAVRGMPEFDRIMDAFINAPAILVDLDSGLDWQRAALIQGAIGAYFDAPIFGHGFTHMMGSIAPHIAQNQIAVADYDHLHSDLADFGVSGGIFGLAALMALLLSPLAAAKAHARSDVFFGMPYLAATMALGYFLLGLTNAVIGILPQTTLFGVLLGFIVGTAKSRTEVITKQ